MHLKIETFLHEGFSSFYAASADVDASTKNACVYRHDHRGGSSFLFSAFVDANDFWTMRFFRNPSSPSRVVIL